MIAGAAFSAAGFSAAGCVPVAGFAALRVTTREPAAEFGAVKAGLPGGSVGGSVGTARRVAPGTGGGQSAGGWQGLAVPRRELSHRQ